MGVELFGKIILKKIYDKYDVYFLLRCFGTRYKYSLFYTIEPCELHNSRQCH